MTITLSNVVPWGRSFEEYGAMFSLAPGDLNSRILGCADGPAAFNAVLTRQGGSIVSVDPLYAFTTEQIRHRIADTYRVILEQVRQSQDDYVWTTIASVEALGQVRMQAMETFLADYVTGQSEGRYVEGSLPDLPFAADRFDLALVSHFLFLYSDHLSVEFHLRSLQTLLRIAPEVRVFPLLTLAGQPSPYLDKVAEQLVNAGHRVAIQAVNYELQKGGNAMMVIQR